MDSSSSFQVLSPSDACRFHGPKVSFEQWCFYHKQKYLSSCETMQCSHLGVMISLKSHSYPDGVLRVSASYRSVPDNPSWKVKVCAHSFCEEDASVMPQQVPNNTVCSVAEKPGRCVNQTCQTRPVGGADNQVKLYSSNPAAHSGLQGVENVDPKKCIIMAQSASPVCECLMLRLSFLVVSGGTNFSGHSEQGGLREIRHRLSKVRDADGPLQQAPPG